MRRAALVALVACGPIYSAPPPPPPPPQKPVTIDRIDIQPAPEPDPGPEPTPTAPTSPPPALVSGGKPPAKRTTQAQIAAHLAYEGEQLYAKASYADASSKFREAVARVPEPRYFYNLCASLFMEGKFSEALTSCEAVQNNSPSPDLASKAATSSTQIRDEAKRQGIDVR